MNHAHTLFEDPSVLELMPTAVYIIDVEGQIRGFNKRAVKFWGQTPKLRDNDHRFCGSLRLFWPDGTALHPEKTPMAAAVELSITRKNGEVVIERPDGTKITVMVNIAPLLDQSGKIIGAINAFEDISEVVAARLKIESHLMELEKRDSFLSICGHELRTPLTALILQSQLLMKIAEKDPEFTLSHEQVKKTILRNLKQYSKLSRLVDDMLDLHRLKTGNLSITLEKADLGVLVKEAVAATAYGMSQDSEKVLVHVTGHMDGLFDRKRIEQVVSNLIGNAVKYGTDGPIEVDVSRSNKIGRIRVHDHGMGIALKDHDRIFERFERVGAEQTVVGLGLGLFVCKQIVEAHHGHIFVESELSKGSTFTVELPLS
jgi:PAS domain S-box-containing protein